MEHSLIQLSGIFARSLQPDIRSHWCMNRNSARKGCNLESFSPDVTKHVIRAVIIVFSLADHRKRNSILSGPKDLAEREPGEGKTNIVVRVNNLEKIAEDNRR